MQASSALGEWPDLVREAFLTKEKNDAGIMAVRLYIKGKPWVVTIDDYHLFYGGNQPQTLRFAKESLDDKAMWGSILEKAWVKVRGNYVRANGDTVENGISALTGIPVFTYKSADIE
jgi:hypothetical protein